MIFIHPCLSRRTSRCWYTVLRTLLLKTSCPIWSPKAAALPPVLQSKVDNISQRCISMSLPIPWGKAFTKYSFRLIWRFEMKKDSLTWSWAKWWLQPGEMWHICRVKEQHSLSLFSHLLALAQMLFHEYVHVCVCLSLWTENCLFGLVLSNYSGPW